ncbi:MAG: LD-carboxypeptidase [Holophaga sp.]|nr:LD-carboxypeptidase [Holophaga sp.]
MRLIAPSGWPKDVRRYELGLTRLKEAGFQVANQGCGLRRDSRFAGTEAERLDDLNALCDPGAPLPDVLMLPRGGYGAIQLLDRIDYARLCPRLREAGTVIVGYSDFTALQMALLAKGGVITFSGPMVYTNLGVPIPDLEMIQSFRRAITSPVVEVKVKEPQTVRGTHEGLFWGGNLCTLVSLVGTPYLPSIKDGILFLEDVDEAPYRVERMLYQLYHAGILGKQRAIILGAFTQQGVDKEHPEFTLQTVIERFRARLGIPLFTGLPCGHIANLASLPVGGLGRLVSDGEGFTLTLTGHPVLRRVPAGFWGPALEAPVHDSSADGPPPPIDLPATSAPAAAG